MDNHKPLHPKFNVNRIFRNSLFLILSRLIGFTLTLVLVAVIARYLSVEMFGYFALVAAAVMIIRPVVDMGMDRIITREISKNHSIAGLYIGNTILVRLMVSTGIYFIIMAGMPFFSSTWPQEVISAMQYALASEIIMSLGVTFLSVIRAFEKMGYELIANTIHKALSLLMTLAAIHLDLGFVGIFYARLGAAIAFILIAYGFMHARFVIPRLRLNWILIHNIIKESYPLAIFSLLLVLEFKVDLFFLQWLKGEAEVALFEAPNRMITQIQIIAISISAALFPQLSRMAGINDLSGLSRTYRNSFFLLTVAGSLFSMLFMVNSKALLVIIFGSHFSDAAVTMEILAPITLFLFLTSLQSTLMVAIGQQKKQLYCILITLVVNISLDLALIPAYGPAGAASATLISYLVMLLVNEYFINHHGIKLNLTTRLILMIPVSLSVLPAGFINLSNHLAEVIARTAAGTFCFVFTALILKVITKKEIGLIAETLLKRKRPPLAVITKNETAK